MAYPRYLAKGSLLLWIAAACSSEDIVRVEPSFVDVTPRDVSAIEGDQVQLAATVRDDQQNMVTDPEVVWTSDDSTIASVDAGGLVTARSPGSVAIRARFQSITGEANVEVSRGPFVQLIPASLTLYMAPGVSPPPQVVAVSNGGGATLEQLGTEVAYAGQPRDWLSPSLASTTAPTSLSLEVAPQGLAAGSHRATVSIASASEGDPADLGVVVNVAGFEVRHSGQGISLAESGATVEIAVVLRSPPSAPVVLLATSSDATEATVTPASLEFDGNDWEREQTITIRGVDDIDDDGDRVSTIRVSVADGQSPEAFEPLPARSISVTTVDDDLPPALVVAESSGSTIVREENTTDAFTVVLAAPVASNVVVDVTSTAPGEVAVISGVQLTFTTGNWDVPRTVTVIGVDDLTADGDQVVPVRVRVRDADSDDRYDGLSRDVAVRNIDDDAGGPFE
jgi:hypothetical protein